MGKAMIEGFECERCKHQWIPRLKTVEEPAMCPKCKSPYWNKPRRIDTAKNLELARFSMMKKRGRNND
jgi:Zn finger protein HypA/HybF involved in hydrogenase expression